MPGKSKRAIEDLYRDDPERADVEVFGRKTPVSRRGFLGGAGLAAMSAAVGGAIPFADLMPGGHRGAENDRAANRRAHGGHAGAAEEAASRYVGAAPEYHGVGTLRVVLIDFSHGALDLAHCGPSLVTYFFCGDATIAPTLNSVCWKRNLQ